MFKELELLAQMPKEEVERKALSAWKHQDEKKKPLWKKMLNGWISKRHGQQKQQLNNRPAIR